MKDLKSVETTENLAAVVALLEQYFPNIYAPD